MMIAESERYNKIVEVIRKSKPTLNSTEEIQREVIRKVSITSHHKLNLSEITDFLFGWVYISWVRRSFIIASVILVLLFVFQQTIILKQIKYLSSQITITGKEKIYDPSDILEKRLMMFKLSGQKIGSGTITISERQMKQLLDTVNNLQIKYKDLMNLIEEDPGMKKNIENKLNEKNRTKIKL